MDRFRLPDRSIFGIVIILIGAALLLSATGVIDAHVSIGTFWPVILIAVGAAKVFNYDESSFIGYVLIIIGAFFQMRNLDVPFVSDLSFSRVFWPGIIILFGLSMIFPGAKGKKVANRPEHFYYDDEMMEDDFLDEE